MAVLPEIGLSGRRRVVAVRPACLVVVAGLALWLAGVVAAAPAAQAAPPDCASVAVGKVSCAVLPSPGSTPGRPAASAAAAPSVLVPVSLRYAYGLEYSALTGGVGQTVAVVTPYDDANAQSDLAAYRTRYSLPPCGSGCFSKMDQDGGTSFPPAKPGWAGGVAEAVDMISAVCPNCHILLVEATSTILTDLGAAENTAVRLGAKFVANAWFTSEQTFISGTDELTYDSQYFNHPGVAITAPDGSLAGHGNTYFPAASPNVIAVGETTLTQASSTVRGWTETVFNGTGSGCSLSEAKPSWQTDTGCSKRMLNDVSAVGDPASPVAYYDTESGGLKQGGGGIVPAALVAAAYALAGTPASGSNPAAYLYAHHGAGLVSDITTGSTTGSTETCPGPAYYCAAAGGYDGPSGVGSLASAMAVGAHAPSDSLPGGPATYNPLDGALQVFGTGTSNGTVWGDTWKRSGGWSGWGNVGGTLAGKPLSAVYDPAGGSVEVWGLGADGHVMENWTTDGAAWAGWHDLGGTFSSEPVAVYDPLNGSLEVWAVGSNHAAWVNSWHPGTGWSGWLSRGGSFSAAVAPVYDPKDRTMRVFGVGTSNGTAWGGSWTPSGGFSGWQNLGGALSGSLSAIYDPMNGDLEVYGRGTNDTAYEGRLTSGSWADWSPWQGMSNPATSTGPSAVHDPFGGTGGTSGTTEVWEASTTGTTFGNQWAPGDGWSGWQNHGGEIASGLYPLYDLASGSLRVFGVGRANGTVFGESWTPSDGYSGWGNMGGTLQTSDF